MIGVTLLHTKLQRIFDMAIEYAQKNFESLYLFVGVANKRYLCNVKTDLWCNGSTTVFGSVCWGSSPCESTTCML